MTTTAERINETKGHGLNIDMGWVLVEHRDKAAELMGVLAMACEDAEKSKAFLDLQMNPSLEWKGWPVEVVEDWLTTRPRVLGRYLDDEVDAEAVGRYVRKHFRKYYARPVTGGRPGTRPRIPVPGLVVHPGLSALLDKVTWEAMRKAGASTDDTGIRQLVKIPAPGEDDHEVVIRSAGTVGEDALRARYTSLRGDLYWADIRNSLEFWIRARPEHVSDYAAWYEAGCPRAWEDAGRWVPRVGGRVEHNPSLLIAATAWKRATDMILKWKNDTDISLDSLLDESGDFLAEVLKPRPERRQHATKQHFAWGLRDDVACYSFPVVSSVSTEPPS